MRDLGALTLRDPEGALEATFLTRLGMVVSSLRHDGQELLALRGGPEAYAATGSTFGIPLLHPWANRLSAWSYDLDGHAVTLDPDSPVTHRDGATGLPSHGLLAASPDWRVESEDAASVTAELDFGDHPELLAAFPFPHRLTYRARVGAGTLTISLTVTPTGAARVPVAFGLHPYLTPPDGERAAWRVELPVRRRVVLSEVGIPTGATVELADGQLDGPLGDRAFDDHFDRLSGDPPVFTVADGRRRIEVRYLDGYPAAQVYTPEGADFICFEPMTAPVNALRTREGLRFAEPGGSFFATFAVSVALLR